MGFLNDPATGSEPRVVRSDDQAEQPAADGSGILDATLASLDDTAGAFDVRLVTIAPGATSTTHEHPWPQVNYIVSGTCAVTAGDETWVLEAGDTVWLPGGVPHGFANHGNVPVTTLCVRGGS